MRNLIKNSDKKDSDESVKYDFTCPNRFRAVFFHGSGSVLNANSDPDSGKKGRSGSGQKDPDPKHCFKGQNIPSVLILKIRTHSVVTVYTTRNRSRCTLKAFLSLSTIENCVLRVPGELEPGGGPEGQGRRAGEAEAEEFPAGAADIQRYTAPRDQPKVSTRYRYQSYWSSFPSVR